MGLDYPPALPALLPASGLNVVRNRIFNEIAIGDTVAILRTLTPGDVQLLAVLLGDINPQYLDADLTASTRSHDTTVHDMLSGALISAPLGVRLPGPGTIYLGQTPQFLGLVHAGDTLITRATMVSKEDASRRVMLTRMCTSGSGTMAITGGVEVIASTERVERPHTTLPDVRVTIGSDGMHQLLNYVRPLGTVRMTTVHPHDVLSLVAAMDVHAGDLIVLCPVAPYAKLVRITIDAGPDLGDIEIEGIPHNCAAATHAVELMTQGRAEALMKGSLHTDELIAAAIRDEVGLRTKHRINYCFLMQSPAYPRLSIATDAVINIVSTLDQKVGIVRNAIDLAHAIGVERPRVAVLAVVETVNPRMPAMLDAVVLCKMTDRSQIEGGMLDGPLAFDSAVSAIAAHIKGLVSGVVRQADVLVVPDLESDDMLAKQLKYLGGAAGTGIVFGAFIPIVLASRTNSRESRIALYALATLLAHRYRNLPP